MLLHLTRRSTTASAPNSPIPAPVMPPYHIEEEDHSTLSTNEEERVTQLRPRTQGCLNLSEGGYHNGLYLVWLNDLPNERNPNPDGPHWGRWTQHRRNGAAIAIPAFPQWAHTEGHQEAPLPSHMRNPFPTPLPVDLPMQHHHSQRCSLTDARS
ncbi:hypothetical protein CALVIDRAFT_379716 [Calocera viscosa TUFC12733]|uniref:Uncharacterized protein n=1 Tax=Calocera viscosa (strain TUFC12733) TaxID=1330018 RepID=A0A167Q437_CALVF|nr:hypothetical protein CALVIDRAFT_379716 [Calocera viscosa TUFC12733]